MLCASSTSRLKCLICIAAPQLEYISNPLSAAFVTPALYTLASCIFVRFAVSKHITFFEKSSNSSNKGIADSLTEISTCISKASTNVENNAYTTISYILSKLRFNPGSFQKESINFFTSKSSLVALRQ